MPRILFLLLVVGWVGPPARTQVLPTRRPAAVSKDEDPRAPVLAAAERALRKGARRDALEHLMHALWLRPKDPAILARVLRVEQDNPDLRALWSHAYFAAAANEQGSVRLSPGLRPLFDGKDRSVKALSQARARAAAELVRKLVRAPGHAALGAEVERRFLRQVVFEMAAGCPGLYEAHGARIHAATEPDLAAVEAVVDALQEVMREGLAEGRPEQALVAARLLQGLAAQANFKDLKGPRPRPFTRERQEAQAALSEAREQLLQRAKVWSVAELEALSPKERLEFTQAHTRFENPGIALSPGGRYRVETTCGHGTLLAAAKSVELHHRRLVAWYGRDPFEERPGVVRIVPDAAGLEAEGEPFWWAGGFQSGDLTTVRFTAGSLASLSPLLTHEFTHRFDGAVHPGLPAWLVEGRAVWTEESFVRTTDAAFLENRVDTARLEKARIKEYGRPGPLRDLLDGTIEDYRDNYDAGYALFLFLDTWMEGDRYLYRPALERFQRSSAGTEASAHRFELEFCDGKEGRPESLERFAEQFERFLRGFLRSQRKPFAGRYQTELLREIGEPIYDAPIWTFDRKRAEPWFGQELAARAGLALQRYGRPEAAARALIFALGVDEWSASRNARLAGLLDELGASGPAWVLWNENHRRAARGVRSPGRSPQLDRLPKTRAYLAALEKAATEYGERGLPLTAIALWADRNRLAVLFGVAPVVPPEEISDAASGAALDSPPFYLGLHGFREDGLSDYEEFRVEGLWYATEEGSLHVGRREPREGTGQLDRLAGRNQAFARSELWLPPGRHRLEMTIHLTTAYVEGAVILGFTRRDRNIRFTFRAGDYDYATGKRDRPVALDFIDCEMHGVRDAESAFAGQTIKTTVRFPTPTTSFRLEFLIDGAMVLALVDGKQVGSYHAPAAQPLEGYVGFAVKSGAMRVERPTVEQYRRRRFTGQEGARTEGLRLDDTGPVTLSGMINRPVSGFETPPEGALMLWVPSAVKQGDPAGPARRAELLQVARFLDQKLEEKQLSTPLVVVLPATLAEAEASELRGHLSREIARRTLFLTHQKSVPLAKLDDAFPVSAPMALFVDPHGVVRSMSPCPTDMAILPHDLTHWLSIYRVR